jgi:hypothetical protein
MARPEAPTGFFAEVIEMIGFWSCLVAQVIEICARVVHRRPRRRARRITGIASFPTVAAHHVRA